ncbi:hypothetical protein [Enterobacter hormaechei]|uniref:hypothetical protein n=1 Tax=Enterobacter hormaechei TaxID=158836 RepID=UPI0032DAAB77
MMTISLTGVLALFIWPAITTGVALTVWWMIAEFPSERSSWIFRRRPVLFLCWLRGEFSLPVTFMSGAPLVAGILWCLGGADWLPDWSGFYAFIAVWSGLSGVALLNASRKRRPEGALRITLVMLITLLFLTSMASVVHTGVNLLAPWQFIGS